MATLVSLYQLRWKTSLRVSLRSKGIFQGALKWIVFTSSTWVWLVMESVVKNVILYVNKIICWPNLARVHMMRTWRNYSIYFPTRLVPYPWIDRICCWLPSILSKIQLLHFDMQSCLWNFLEFLRHIEARPGEHSIGQSHVVVTGSVILHNHCAQNKFK